MNNSIFDDMLELQREMIRLISEASNFPNSTLTIGHTISSQWQPKCDLYQTTDTLIVVFDLAGVDKETIKISTSPETLTVSGERHLSIDGTNASFYTMEIESGHFERKLFLPDLPLDHYNPEVDLENGLLKISFRIQTTSKRTFNIEIK